MTALNQKLLKLAKQNPSVRKALIRELRRAKFERGEDVPLEDLPDELQDNVEDPPPEVQDLKEEMQRQARRRRSKRAYSEAWILLSEMVGNTNKRAISKRILGTPRLEEAFQATWDKMAGVIDRSGLDYAIITMQTLCRTIARYDDDAIENTLFKIKNSIK